jgi:hypothetical protein
MTVQEAWSTIILIFASKCLPKIYIAKKLRLRSQKSHTGAVNHLQRDAHAPESVRTSKLSSTRASCAADWAEALPAHVVAKWLGHSPLVAAKHYRQTRDAHFEVAIRGMPRVGEAEAHAAPVRATA